MAADRVACITCDREFDLDSCGFATTLGDGETGYFCSARCAATRVIANESGPTDYERPELQDWPPIVKRIGRAIAEHIDLDP